MHSDGHGQAVANRPIELVRKGQRLRSVRLSLATDATNRRRQNKFAPAEYIRTRFVLTAHNALQDRAMTTKALPTYPTAQLVLFLSVLACSTTAFACEGHTDHSSAPSGFVADNDAAMARMMEAMHVSPSGDVDRDFVEMMVPHHQGAIDMAQAMLRYGTSEPLKRLAQEIIITQEQEIFAMRLAIGDPLPTQTTASVQQSPTNPHHTPH